MLNTNILNDVKWDCVHIIDESEFKVIIDKLKCETFIADFKFVQCKDDILSEFKRALNFPSYFGHNWDALVDCLSDLSWLDIKDGVVLVINDADWLIENNKRDFGTIISIWLNVAEFWSKYNVSFHLIFNITKQ